MQSDSESSCCCHTARLRPHTTLFACPVIPGHGRSPQQSIQNALSAQVDMSQDSGANQTASLPNSAGDVSVPEKQRLKHARFDGTCTSYSKQLCSLASPTKRNVFHVTALHISCLQTTKHAVHSIEPSLLRDQDMGRCSQPIQLKKCSCAATERSSPQDCNETENNHSHKSTATKNERKHSATHLPDQTPPSVGIAPGKVNK